MSIVHDQPSIRTLADLIERLGGIPLDRIRFRPAPGTATEADVAEVEAREGRLCELVDGVLVEKAMGYRESVIAGAILSYLRAFVRPRKLGLVSGADGMARLFPGLVRIPDVAFASWARVPGGVFPRNPVPDLVPDLVVEVLSQGNTEPEMARKCGEYFTAGVRILWIVDPEARTVRVATGMDAMHTLAELDVLDGGDVLPGFALSLRELFAELDERAG
jgi:Uma2 family endonuclease